MRHGSYNNKHSSLRSSRHPRTHRSSLNLRLQGVSSHRSRRFSPRPDCSDRHRVLDAHGDSGEVRRRVSSPPSQISMHLRKSQIVRDFDNHLLDVVQPSQISGGQQRRALRREIQHDGVCYHGFTASPERAVHFHLRLLAVSPIYLFSSLHVSGFAERCDIQTGWCENPSILISFKLPLIKKIELSFIFQVRRANLERARLSRLQKKEIGLATMLLCVVIVFFFCNIMALINNLIEAFYGVIYDQLVKTSNLLVTINSSVNFVVYVTFGEKFKRLFLKLFCSPFASLIGSSGRESPDGTHDLSLISNGDNRTYSLRNTQSSLIRTNTPLIKNGGMFNQEYKKQGSKSFRSGKQPVLAPCVYYPGRNPASAELESYQSTSLNRL